MRQHDRITRQNGLDTGFERHAEGEPDTVTSEKHRIWSTEWDKIQVR